MSIFSTVKDTLTSAATIASRASRLAALIKREEKKLRRAGYDSGLILDELIQSVEAGKVAMDVKSLELFLSNPKQVLEQRRARLGSAGFPPTGHQREVTKLTLPKTHPNYTQNVEHALAFLQQSFLTEYLPVREVRDILLLFIQNNYQALAVIAKSTLSSEAWQQAVQRFPNRMFQDRMVLLSGETV